MLVVHPADFAPVCTTELGAAARLEPELAARNVEMAAVIADAVDSHRRWIADIEETQHVKVSFPLIADADRRVSELYDAIHPEADAKIAVRSVFFIDPEKRIRAMITYPTITARQFDEILRVFDALQLADAHAIVTPANWGPGDDCFVDPRIANDEVKERFPRSRNGGRPYVRVTPAPKP